MANFEEAYDITMGNEGAYSNDPDDPGGETWKGIARKRHPNWSGWAVVDVAKSEAGFPGNLKNNEALEIEVRAFYKKTFWNVFFGDEIPSQVIANELFDTGVNTGSGKAAIFLQTALNILNRNEKLYADISIDGDIGSGTMNALKTLLAIPGEDAYLYKVLNILQGYHYINLMLKSESQEKYARGWLNRVSFIKG